MGVGRIRARYQRPRWQKSSPPHRTHRFRRPRDAPLRAMAENYRPRGPINMDLRRRSLLETLRMSAPLTAGEVVARIKSHLGFPWRETTYRDTFKFGGPDTVVKGIATTMFCSYDTIRRAAAAGCNMIIPHEDTYWNDRDDTTIVSADHSYKR